MRFLLVYYTGTYHTRFLTDKIQKRLEARGHTVERTEINADTMPVNTQGYDLIGLGYPIYGFNSPLPFNRYLKKLNFERGQKFFIYKDSGETFAMNNASSRVILRRMKRRGLNFRGEYHFVMPYNIHFPFEDAFVREILKKDAKLVEIMIYNLEKGRVNEIKSNPVYDLAAFFVSVQKMGGAVNSFFYRVDADKCVRCMKCVNECPEKNIRFEKGKIRFSHRCDMCMRCSFYCPAAAIKIGFLEGWKVNGDYRLEELEQDDSPVAPYIGENSAGFYRCFIRTFAAIDEEYARLFPDPS